MDIAVSDRRILYMGLSGEWAAGGRESAACAISRASPALLRHCILIINLTYITISTFSELSYEHVT